MNVQIYLLDMTEFNEEETGLSFIETASMLVDETRRSKAERIRNPKSKRTSLGAGILLQKMALDYYNGFRAQEMQRFSASELVKILKKQQLYTQLPLPMQYRFGTYGKPEIVGVSWRFNLSHSGDYILLAASEREVGADIQQYKKGDYMKLSKRFFAQSESQLLETCENEENRKKMYYKLWTQKEAYGKLTGQGVSKVLDLMTDKMDVDWVKIDILPGYASAICVDKS